MDHSVCHMECYSCYLQIVTFCFLVSPQSAIELYIFIFFRMDTTLPQFLTRSRHYHYPCHHERIGILDSRQFPEEKLSKHRRAKEC